MRTRLQEFDDFVGFLRAHGESRRTKNPLWSYGAWAKKLKLSGAAAITMVLNGQREPGPKLLERLVEYFGFEGEDKEYFLDLARAYRYRDDPAVGPYLREQLARRRGSAGPSGSSPRVSTLTLDVFGAIGQWYFYALREMTGLRGFVEDPEWISRRLRFRVAPDRIERALQTLVGLGLLARDPSTGSLKPSPETIDTPPGVQAAAIRDFHGQVLDLGKKALRRIPVEEREFSSITLNVSRDRLPEIKKFLSQFQDQFCQLAEVPSGDDIYQLNLQFFPLTQGVPS